MWCFCTNLNETPPLEDTAPRAAGQSDNPMYGGIHNVKWSCQPPLLALLPEDQN